MSYRCLSWSWFCPKGQYFFLSPRKVKIVLSSGLYVFSKNYIFGDLYEDVHVDSRRSLVFPDSSFSLTFSVSPLDFGATGALRVLDVSRCSVPDHRDTPLRTSRCGVTPLFRRTVVPLGSTVGHHFGKRWPLSIGLEERCVQAPNFKRNGGPGPYGVRCFHGS